MGNQNSDTSKVKLAVSAVQPAVVPDEPAVVADQAPAETVFPTTLHEFCVRLSQTDKRVELIAAFHYTETVSGTVKDTEAAFSARFSAFLNKPV